MTAGEILMKTAALQSHLCCVTPTFSFLRFCWVLWTKTWSSSRSNRGCRLMSTPPGCLQVSPAAVHLQFARNSDNWMFSTDLFSFLKLLLWTVVTACTVGLQSSCLCRWSWQSWRSFWYINLKGNFLLQVSLIRNDTLCAVSWFKLPNWTA